MPSQRAQTGFLSWCSLPSPSGASCCGCEVCRQASRLRSHHASAVGVKCLEYPPQRLLADRSRERRGTERHVTSERMFWLVMLCTPGQDLTGCSIIRFHTMLKCRGEFQRVSLLKWASFFWMSENQFATNDRCLQTYCEVCEILDPRGLPWTPLSYLTIKTSKNINLDPTHHCKHYFRSLLTRAVGCK